MICTDLRSKLFDTVMEAALRDNFQQELDEIPGEAVLATSYSPSSELNQKIRKIISKSNHRLFLRKAGKISRRAAVITAVILPVAAAGLLSVEASRNVIFNAILNWKSNHVEMKYETDSAERSTGAAAEADASAPAYLPDGFTEKSSETVGKTTVTEYQNKENVRIRLTRSPISSAGTTGIDTEHSTYKEIIINGYKASLFAAKTSKDSTILVWRNKTTSFMLVSPIDKEELIKMATSISED